MAWSWFSRAGRWARPISSKRCGPDRSEEEHDVSDIETIAILGAGGKMGCRITDNLRGSKYRMKYVEVSEAGKQNLRQRGLEATPAAEALRACDAVILAVPDNRIAQISAE